MSTTRLQSWLKQASQEEHKEPEEGKVIIQKDETPKEDFSDATTASTADVDTAKPAVAELDAASEGKDTSSVKDQGHQKLRVSSEEASDGNAEGGGETHPQSGGEVETDVDTGPVAEAEVEGKDIGDVEPAPAGNDQLGDGGTEVTKGGEEEPTGGEGTHVDKGGEETASQEEHGSEETTSTEEPSVSQEAAEEPTPSEATEPVVSQESEDEAGEGPVKVEGEVDTVPETEKTAEAEIKVEGMGEPESIPDPDDKINADSEVKPEDATNGEHKEVSQEEHMTEEGSALPEDTDSRSIEDNVPIVEPAVEPEDVAEPEGEPSPAEEPSDTGEVSETELTLGDVEETDLTVNTDRSIGQIQEDIDGLTRTATGIERYADLMSSSLEKGGLSPMTAEAIRIGMESLDPSLGGEAIMVSNEHFGELASPLSSTRVSVEQADSSYKKVWEYIKKAIAELIKQVKLLWDQHMSSLARVEKRLKDIGSDIDKLTDAATGETQEVNNASRLMLDGQFVGTDGSALQQLAAVSKYLSVQYPPAAAEMVRKIGDLRGDYGQEDIQAIAETFYNKAKANLPYPTATTAEKGDSATATKTFVGGMSLVLTHRVSAGNPSSVMLNTVTSTADQGNASFVVPGKAQLRQVQREALRAVEEARVLQKALREAEQLQKAIKVPAAVAGTDAMKERLATVLVRESLLSFVNAVRGYNTHLAATIQAYMAVIDVCVKRHEAEATAAKAEAAA